MSENITNIPGLEELKRQGGDLEKRVLALRGRL